MGALGENRRGVRVCAELLRGLQAVADGGRPLTEATGRRYAKSSPGSHPAAN